MSEATVPGAAMTVLGPVPAAALGRTLAHEHLAHDLASRGVPGEHPLARVQVTHATAPAVAAAPFSCADDLRFVDRGLIACELVALADAGVRTVVDVTCPELRRDAHGLQVLAEASGINVIASCGHYLGALHAPDLTEEPVASIAERLERELRDGIGATNVRAGMLKAAASQPLHPSERKVLAAAARAQAATGAPLTVHLSHLGCATSNGHEVLTLLEAEGADLTRVVLAHVDLTLAPGGGDRPELAYQRELAARGALLGYDTVGHEGEIELPGGARVTYPSDRDRAAAIAGLLDAGLREQLIVSNDIVTKVRLKAFGGSGYGHVVEGFPAELERVGVGAATLDALLVDNPRRLLAVW